MKTTFLDGIRGLAAFYVMVGHARWLLWEGYSLGYSQNPESYSFFSKVFVYFFSAFRYGHEAVLLFFVLSGFVIHLKYSKSLKAEPKLHFDFFSFFQRRLRRIVPPLIFAIILTFLLDQLGLWLKLPIYDEPTIYQTINQNINTDHSILTLFGNLLFLMDIYVPVFGTNGPLWSLAYEWWFYMIYPVFFYLSRKSQTLATTIVILLYFGINWLPNEFKLTIKVFSLFPVWWMGVLLADIYTNRLKVNFKNLIPLALLLLVIPFFNTPIQLIAMNQIIWGLGFTGWFALLFFIQKKGGNLWFLDGLKNLGSISYSLYVIHLPIIVFISALILEYSNSDTLPSAQYYILLGIIISLLVSYPVYLIAEKPFQKRQRIQRTHD